MPQNNQPGFTGANDEQVQDALAPQSGADIPPDRRAKDPVCGGVVDTRTARFTANYMVGGTIQTFYFTSDECKQEFEREPDKYSNLI
jgi:YHS domain-containing protein